MATLPEEIATKMEEIKQFKNDEDEEVYLNSKGSRIEKLRQYEEIARDTLAKLRVLLSRYPCAQLEDAVREAREEVDIICLQQDHVRKLDPHTIPRRSVVGGCDTRRGGTPYRKQKR